jgi:hypothetical protein
MDNLIKSIILTPLNILYKINHKLELEILFRLKCGYKLNLKDPKTYNEKIQWIKLNDHNPMMTKCCDKYAVREYVERKNCREILNELIWEGFHPENIPFDSLPDKFVIKVTHGSTFNIICTDKSKLDRVDVIKKCKKWLKAKFLEPYGEWFYGVEKPRVIVEEYLDDGTGRLRDYKVYCFNGKPRFIGVDSGDESKGTHYKDIYDLCWNLIPEYEMAYPNSGIPMEKPEALNELLKYATILSEDFLHARADFYIVNGKIVFGEITFSNSAGFGRVEPKEFALKMGGYLKLPEVK